MELRSGPVWLLCLTLGFAQDSKPDPPGQESQAKAEKDIREVFKDDYAQKSPAGQRKLARLLLKQAAQTKDDLTAQYVLLRETLDLATRSGDVEALLGALDGLCNGFKSDPLDLRMTALLKAEPAVTAAEDRRQLIDALIELARDALAVDHFESASKAAQAFLSAAKRSKDIALATRAETAVRAVEEAKAAWEKARAAEDILKRSPNEGSAHQIRGEYLCFIKGQWEQGLPHLSAGTDPTLQALAKKELSDPVDAAAKLAIADGWWELYTAEKSPLRKIGIRNHARSLYELAYPAATGLLRIKLDARLAENGPGHGPLESRRKATRDGLVAWWKCDEGKGNSIADASGSGHSGTLTNVVWVNDPKGPALKFNGSSSFLVQPREPACDPSAANDQLVALPRLGKHRGEHHRHQ
jgi:hypothetical protein